jgi:hypothetical protein
MTQDVELKFGLFPRDRSNKLDYRDSQVDSSDNIKPSSMIQSILLADERAITDPLTDDEESGFYLDEYELDKDHWCEGFITE